MSAVTPLKHVVIIGSGLGGLTAALRLTELSPATLVTLVTKGRLEQSNTAWAQGGMAVVTETGAEVAGDSVESHIADTLAAGAGLCWREAVEVLCTDGPDRFTKLVEWGVRFDRGERGVSLGLEAAHEHPRIVHAGGDTTGAALINALTAKLRESDVDVREHTVLVDLVVDAGRVTGVDLLDADGVQRLDADAVVLATGGAGQLFRHTTNPLVATGDGVAAAFRAGAMLTDLEMVQFHPTALAVPGSFLISEAVRGEGAVLIDQRGHRFMTDLDERGELAPRDVVARGIQQTMIAQGGQPVLLDATALGEEMLARRFPAITKACRSYGLNWAREPIPVTPAAHYWMGGVATDTAARTSLAGLFAVGEVACTGVHGANRLASNSLLEAVVFAERAVQTMLHTSANPSEAWPMDAPSARWAEQGALLELSLNGAAGNDVVDRVELQTMMWDSVGLARTASTLDTAREQCASWRPASAEHRTFSDWEDANLLQLARIVTESAIAREESRGAHFRLDYPTTVSTANRPILVMRKKSHD